MADDAKNLGDAGDIQVVYSGLRFPEGPVHLSDGSVMVVEIAGGVVARIWPDGTRSVVATTGGGPNGLAIGPDGKAYVCNNGGFTWTTHAGRLAPASVIKAEDYSGGRIERVDLASGSVETLYTHGPNGPLNGPNDIVFDNEGGFWFTDLGKYRDRTIDRGAVYYATPDGRHINEVVFPSVTPNGIGLSPDGKTLYVAESQTARLWAFGVQGAGVLSKAQWPSPHGGELVYGAPGYQIFDSLAVEANGNICIGTLVSAGITVVSAGGDLVDFVQMPGNPTNICFGGTDNGTAFITLSDIGDLVKMKWARSGLLINNSI